MTCACTIVNGTWDPCALHAALAGRPAVTNVTVAFPDGAWERVRIFLLDNAKWIRLGEHEVEMLAFTQTSGQLATGIISALKGPTV